MSVDVWGRFRQRLLEGNQQARYLKEWSNIRSLTNLMVDIDRMDEAAFQYFRNAMILVDAAYAHRAGLVGITDPVEWQRRYEAYLTSPEPDAARYKMFLTLRGELEKIRKPQDQQPLYSSEELSLSEACNKLFSPLAITLNQAVPGLASKDVIDRLQALIGEYGKLLAKYKASKRACRQAEDAIAEAKYAIARTYLILKDYKNAKQGFQDALDAFEELRDQSNVQACRQQLTSLRVVESGDVDAAVRANLEVLTGEKGQARSLDRTSALVGQLGQSLRVGDTFEATKLLTAAVDELKRQQYLDPGLADVEPFFGQWVESVPAALQRTDFLRELAQVVQLYAAIFGARATLSPDPQVGEQQKALWALLNRMGHESQSADAEIERLFAQASARPLGPDGAASA